MKSITSAIFMSKANFENQFHKRNQLKIQNLLNLFSSTQLISRDIYISILSLLLIHRLVPSEPNIDPDSGSPLYFISKLIEKI
jgi:hypothetical protein